MPKLRTPAARRPRSAPSHPAFAPVPTRARHDGWTPERQTAFLDALAESGCVAEACAAVGISAQSAYRLRMRVDAQGFRMAWDAALDLAVRRLSDACFSRALNGEAVPHFYQGEQVGEHRRYDNRLAMFLLRYRDPLRYAATLDQMVYSGHPEGAALAFTRARDRAGLEAHGIADEPGGGEERPPFTATVLPEAARLAVEEALVAGDRPVAGSSDRRRRILERRHARVGAEQRRAAVPPEPLPMPACSGWGAPFAPAAEEPAGGDVPSPSSPSAARPPAPRAGPAVRTP